MMNLSMTGALAADYHCGAQRARERVSPRIMTYSGRERVSPEWRLDKP